MLVPISRKPASKPVKSKSTKCAACGGTGKSSRGGPCIPCQRRLEKERTKQ